MQGRARRRRRRGGKKLALVAYSTPKEAYEEILHNEVHVTTVFVIHDQEEAMDLAEQIVVINQGQILHVRAHRPRAFAA